MNKNPLASILKLKSALPLITALLFLTAPTLFSQRPEIYLSTGHSSSILQVAFSPDGKLLAGLDYDFVRLWDVTSGRELRTLKDDSGLLNSFAFSPDGKTIATGSGSMYGRIIFWNIASGQQEKTILGPTNTIVFSPNGETLASTNLKESSVKLWDSASARELKTFRGHLRSVVAIAFSPNGETLATGGHDNLVKLWNVETEREIRTLTGHSSLVYTVAFSPDGKQIASAESLVPQGNCLKIWDAESGLESYILEGLKCSSQSVTFSPDGKTVAIGARVGGGVFDLATKRLTKFETQTGSGVAFSPDGQTLAIGSWNGSIILRDMLSGKELKEFKGHTFRVDSVAFSPDQTVIASSGRSGIILWDVRLGSELRTLKAGYVRSLAFNADGKILLSGGGGQRTSAVVGSVDWQAA